MNYDFYLDGNSPVLLRENVKLFQNTRPLIGDIIQIPGFSGTFDIIRSDPTNNPAGEKVIYYVKKHVDKLIKDDPQAQVESFYNSTYT